MQQRVLGTSAPDLSSIKFPRLDKPLFKVYWFPFSAGAATSGSLFHTHLPPGTEVVCFNTPSKQKDPSVFPDFTTAVNFFVPRIVADLAATPNVRFALIGHSFGSLLVYLVLVRLRSMGHRMPEAVFISSKRAPQLHAVDGNQQLLRASYAENEEWYLRHHGKTLPEKLRNDPAILKTIVTAFVIDMKVNQSFWMDKLSEEERKPLDVPCTVYWGANDTVVTRAEIEPWRELFVGAGPVVVFPGIAHMLFGPAERQKEILAVVAKLITK